MAAFAGEEEITIQCQTVAQSLSNLSNENKDTISKESLEQFFSQCALTFGQESNGKTEAIDLIAVLKAKQIDTSTFDNDNVSREDFMVWLKERFVEHPHHLVDLVNVVNDLINSKNRTTTNVIASHGVDTNAGTDTLKVELDSAKKLIIQLREEKAALHAKVQDVSNHHARVLKSALTAAKIERTNALHNGLGELLEKNKR
jgi:hypothetical protein